MLAVPLLVPDDPHRGGGVHGLRVPRHHRADVRVLDGAPAVPVEPRAPLLSELFASGSPHEAHKIDSGKLVALDEETLDRDLSLEQLPSSTTSNAEQQQRDPDQLASGPGAGAADLLLRGRLALHLEVELLHCRARGIPGHQGDVGRKRIAVGLGAPGSEARLRENLRRAGPGGALNGDLDRLGAGEALVIFDP